MRMVLGIVGASCKSSRGWLRFQAVRTLTAKWAFIKDKRDGPGVWITLHLQPFVPDPLSPSCKPDRNRRWIWLSPFYRVEKLRYETITCLYKGLLAPSVLGLNLQIWLPLDTLLSLLRLQTLPDDSASPLGWFCSDPPSWSWWHAELSAIGQSC